MIEAVPLSIYMCIVESFWRKIPKHVFNQI